MNKSIPTLCACALLGLASSLIAEPTLDEFRQQVEALRKQERALTKQRDAVHKERKAAEYKLVVWENEGTLNDAIASL